MSDNSGADLKENLRQNLTNSSKSDTKMGSISSSRQDVAVTEPVAASTKVLIEVWAKNMENTNSTADLVRNLHCQRKQNLTWTLIRLD